MNAMNEKEKTNYDRIQEAIEYITTHFKTQPGLDEVAEKIHLSPYHFQRLFTDWAGVSPKKFLQYISIEHAKNILKERKASLFDAAFETGLSGTGRLHAAKINKVTRCRIIINHHTVFIYLLFIRSLFLFCELNTI